MAASKTNAEESGSCCNCWKKVPSGWVIAIVGIILSMALAVVKLVITRNGEYNAALQSFDVAARIIESSVVTGWRTTNVYHQMIANLFITKRGAVSRSEFTTFVDPDVYFKTPFFQVMEFNPLVLAADRPLYEAEGRLNSPKRVNYSFCEPVVVNGITNMVRLADNLFPEYVPNHVLEPFPGNENALGHTVTSPARLAVFERIRRVGGGAATNRIVLVQRTVPTFATVVYLPIFKLYANNSDPATRINGSTPVWNRSNYTNGTYPADLMEIPWRVTDPKITLVDYRTDYLYGFITHVVKYDVLVATFLSTLSFYSNLIDVFLYQRGTSDPNTGYLAHYCLTKEGCLPFSEVRDRSMADLQADGRWEMIHIKSMAGAGDLTWDFLIVARKGYVDAHRTVIPWVVFALSSAAIAWFIFRGLFNVIMRSVYWMTDGRVDVQIVGLVTFTCGAITKAKAGLSQATVLPEMGIKLERYAAAAATAAADTTTAGAGDDIEEGRGTMTEKAAEQEVDKEKKKQQQQ